MFIYSYQDTMDIIYFSLIKSILELHHVELRSNLIFGISIGIAIGVIIMTIAYECYIHFLAPEVLYKKLPKKFKEKYIEKSGELAERKGQLDKDKTVSKEIIIRERVKVTYTLPETCPKCKAELKYGDVTMRGPDKVECSYCNSTINLIEKEIWYDKLNRLKD